MSGAGLLHRSALVVAHPDDEVLWFASIVSDVDRVVMVHEDNPDAPLLGDARRRVVETFPHDDVISLGLREAGTLRLSPFRPEDRVPHGVRFGPRSLARSSKRYVRRLVGHEERVRLRLGSPGHGTPDGARAPLASAARHYADNYPAIVAALREPLAGVENVFTHGPWGEYGHEDHVQVFRAVQALRAEAGFALWVPGYVSPRSAALAAASLDLIGPDVRTLPTDVAHVERIKALYEREGCWTWHERWRWPDEEFILPIVPDAAAPRSSVPMHVVRMPSGRRSAPP